jgi:lipoate-protein ligase A
MKKWRLLDTGILNAAENIAQNETLLEAKKNKIIPNTVRFLQFFPPAVLLGYHQSLEQEIRIDFCKKAGIDINRRITGGGTIFFDETQLGWEIYCEKKFFNMRIADTDFFEKLSEPVIFALRKIGIKASFRPRNDIEVNGRKISGTGGTEEGDAFLFQGTLLVDFDIETMLKALRIPIEKLKDKEINSAKERVTCLKWELGYVPDIDKLKLILKESFEKKFNIVLESRGLTQEEKLLFKEKKNKFESQDHINKIKLPMDEQQTICSIFKADGGLIKISLMINLRYNRIRSIVITGDFFAYPKRTIFDLEAELKNISANKEIIEEKINSFFERNQSEIPGITSSDFVNAIYKALEKIDMVNFGIPLGLSNKIFTVNGSFAEVFSKSPRHLLLPYCAKSIDCDWRYKRDCIKCGKCCVGDAYKLGKDRKMNIATIVSFEDLINTLEKFKHENISSYIGCCCEAFYTKHIEDFEKSGIPAILVDIDNTTCYELGKEEEAYKGNFESKTDINIELLKKVIDAEL